MALDVSCASTRLLKLIGHPRYSAGCSARQSPHGHSRFYAKQKIDKLPVCNDQNLILISSLHFSLCFFRPLLSLRQPRHTRLLSFQKYGMHLLNLQANSDAQSQVEDHHASGQDRGSYDARFHTKSFRHLIRQRPVSETVQDLNSPPFFCNTLAS